MAQQLLKTKFHLPVARADVVRRPRLTGLIDRGLQGRLTLIAAPAGAGKSTLVSEWRESKEGRGRRFAWLSLDEVDNDPIRFCQGQLRAELRPQTQLKARFNMLKRVVRPSNDASNQFPLSPAWIDGRYNPRRRWPSSAG